MLLTKFLYILLELHILLKYGFHCTCTIRLVTQWYIEVPLDPREQAFLKTGPGDVNNLLTAVTTRFPERLFRYKKNI